MREPITWSAVLQFVSGLAWIHRTMPPLDPSRKVLTTHIWWQSLSGRRPVRIRDTITRMSLLYHCHLHRFAALRSHRILRRYRPYWLVKLVARASVFGIVLDSVERVDVECCIPLLPSSVEHLW